MFSLIKQSFKNKWYMVEDVRTFVQIRILTKDEYKQITGQDYDIVADPQPA